MYPPKEHDTPIAVEPFYRDDIESYLEGATEYQDQLRTVVLHSEEATGKSTVAITYALSRHLRLGTPFILWVDCSDRISIKRSFSAIAQKLQLPGYDVRDHDTNRDLVVDWLEDTGLSKYSKYAFDGLF